MALFTSALDKCLNVDDFRSLAKKRLPRMVFDYLDGGAGDEKTIARNRDAFDDFMLLPRTLRDVDDIDLSTTVMGQKIDIPLILAPTGLTRLFHHQGERLVAPAAARAGTIYGLSTLSSTSLEEVAALSSGPKWFQVYVWRDRGIVREFIQRSRDAGYQALCLTVDANIPGNRERDIRHGMTVPPSPTFKSALEMLSHPRWLYHYLTSPPFEMANVATSPSSSPGATAKGDQTLMDYVSSQFDKSVTWEDAAWMIKEWGGPFAIKGIMCAEDARRAVDVGASAIVVSNHGGRQLDHLPSTIEMLSEIVEAVAGRAEVIIDSGIRRGTDILTALALGATACMIGRPYLYALAAGGERGIDRLMTLLRAELERDMALLGCKRISDLTPDLIRVRS